MPISIPRYDPDRSYEWNYDHVPEPLSVEVPGVASPGTYAGLAVPFPLAVAAGPLLNGKWCLYYASAGFDVVTYKTVRTRARECYPLPNLVPVDSEQLISSGQTVSSRPDMRDTWAVSFGMPSQEPKVWRADVEWTRRQLAAEKLLVVSVVGTATEQGGLDELAEDYARCAAWARESGADVVEANFSCPNVCTADGQLYQDPRGAALVAEAIRDAIGDCPLILKVGFLERDEEIAALLAAVSPFAKRLAVTNGITAQIRHSSGEIGFQGQSRGICGRAIFEASVNMVRRTHRIASSMPNTPGIIGVGGVYDATDMRAYLDAGAEAVQLATAAMVTPLVALHIRRQWMP